MDKCSLKIAKRFADRMRSAFDAEQVIFFGSRARGDNFRSSDFDFIVISKEFEGTPFIERLPKVYDFWEENVDVEAIFYTPREFKLKTKEHGIVRKAVKEGIEV